MTTADYYREMIQLHAAKQRRPDTAPIETSERIETLWRAIDAHLKAADLCELLCEDSAMLHHLSAVQRLLARLPEECFH